MKKEYEEITNAGFLLQVDCPDLAMERHITFRDETDAEFVRRVEEQVDALNHALSDVPAERTRMHICWGITRHLIPEMSRLRQFCVRC